METENIAKTIIGLTIGVLLIAYVLPVGIEALFSTEIRSWGFVDNPSDIKYNTTHNLWQDLRWDNGTLRVAPLNITSKQETRTTSLYKLMPVFSILCAIILLIIVVLKYI